MSGVKGRSGRKKKPVSLTETKKSKTSEIGAIGTQIYGGYITGEEFNAELRESAAIDTYDKMYRTDAQIKSTVLLMTLPIRAAAWDVEPASQDESDIEIADEVRRQLFNNDNFTFDVFLRNLLYYLIYGFYVFEKVWEVKDGVYQINNLAPRKPKTITRWIQDATGRLDAVEQSCLFPNGAWNTVLIPNNKLLIFTNEQEGNNWRGMSIFRAVYKNWKMKDTEIRIDAIRHERFGIGIPLVTLPENQKEGDLAAAQEACETFRAHEKGYVIKPNDFGFEILDMKAQSTTDIISSIKYHDTEITSNILAQFLSLGKTETGSRALGGDLQNTFYCALQSVAKYITDVLNGGIEGRRLVKDIVDYNFGNVEKYPKVTCSKISSIDYGALATTLRTLTDGGIVKPSFALEKWISKEMNLPEPEEQEEAEPIVPVVPETEIPEEIPEGEPADEEKADEKDELKSELKEHRHVHLKERRPGEYWRPLTEIEKSIGLQEMDEKINDYYGLAIGIGNKYRQDMINWLTEKSVKLLTTKMNIDEFSQALIETKVPGKGKMASELSGALREVYYYSRMKLRNELFKEPVEFMDVEFVGWYDDWDEEEDAVPVPEKKKRKGLLIPIFQDDKEVRRLSSALSDVAVSVLSVKLWNEWRKEMIDQKHTGIVNTTQMKQRLLDLSKNDFKAEMQADVTKVFGLSRAAEAYKNKDDITSIIHSEIMDNNTCSECLGVDGMEFTGIDDPDFAPFATGQYDQCEGGNKCRGINLFLTS
jgi:hypothetical protein